MEPIPKPGIHKILKCKCPRCRRGDMFLFKNPYSTRKFMRMHEKCEVCGQYFDIEVGFYYGSSYVSYGLAVAISVATFIAWMVFFGISANDNRIFYWLAANGLILILMQPYLMRFSRTLWLSFFVKYDPKWNTNPVKRPERLNEKQKNAW